MDQIDASTPAFLSAFGVSATYRPLGDSGNDKSITAIIVKEQITTVYDTRMGEESYKLVPIHFSSRSNTEGHVAPTEYAEDIETTGDQIVIGSDTWYLKQLQVDGRESGGIHEALFASTEDGAKRL